MVHHHQAEWLFIRKNSRNIHSFMTSAMLDFHSLFQHLQSTFWHWKE